MKTILAGNVQCQNHSPHPYLFLASDLLSFPYRRSPLQTLEMGIQNLLRFMKPFIEPVHIKKYSGQRVGIDAYSWLHKGAYSCSMELCLNSRTEAAKRYLKYFMHHIDLLRHYKITPVVVFDGGYIPCKSATVHDRHRRRESNLELAKEKLKQGDVNTAVEFFQKAVQVTPSMVHQLIQILRLQNVEFVVAPYEADAQLAYLSSLDADQGGIAAIITEDSDLMAYGCQVIIFKMDKYGNGEEFVMDKLLNTVSDGLSFQKFDKELFAGMCVLAGCDFLPSIPGIGTKRAYSLVSKYKNLDRVLSTLKFDKRYQMPEDYSESFMKAVAVFLYARIYDAKTKSLKSIKPLDQKYLQVLNEDLDLLGPELPSSIAAAIAEGHLNPVTMEAYDSISTVEACFSNISTPSPNHINSYEFQVQLTEESTTIFTQESSFTNFADPDTGNEKLMQTETVVFDEKKYKKDSLALGKLIAPARLDSLVVEDKVDTRGVPNNNPFKKRKPDDDGKEVPDNNPFKKGKLQPCDSVQKECWSEPISVLTTVETAVDMLCSSPGEQDSVESKPKKKMPVASMKQKPKTKTEPKAINNKRNGILSFFKIL